jgi:two-component system LytT family response regulator
MNLNPTFRVLISDDEFHARQRILQLLENELDFQVVAECANGLETVNAIREQDPDVLFLDIQMPELDGFGVVETIGPGDMPSTIFTTAFNQHAIQAFEVNALDYLLKPIDPERLAKSLTRVRSRHQAMHQGDIQMQLEGLLSVVRHQDEHLVRILVKQGDHHVIVKVQDIQWVEAEGNYARLHVEDTSHMLRASMASLIAKLDPKVFRRIHRSSIVNLDFVREIHPWFSGEHILVMKDGTRLTLSRSYRDQFKELF